MRVIHTRIQNYFDIINYKDDGAVAFRIDFASDELYASYLKFNYTKDNLFYDIL